ncbi:MAG: LysR substrate-binding domain-containing protein [Pseudomonadota bacterium]
MQLFDDAVRSGLGVAVLPCYLGEPCPELVRIDAPDDRVSWDLWLLAHPDVRRSARVQAFFGFAGSSITADTLGVPQVQEGGGLRT